MGANFSKGLVSIKKDDSDCGVPPPLDDPPIPPAPDPRLPLTAKQLFNISKSWKGIARAMEPTGVTMFVRLFEQNEDILHLFQKFQYKRIHELHRDSMELAQHASIVMATLDESIRILGNVDYFMDYLHSVGKLHRKIPGFQRDYFWLDCPMLLLMAVVEFSSNAAYKTTIGRASLFGNGWDDNKHHQGVGLLLSRHASDDFLVYECINERFLTAKFPTSVKDLNVICCYAPTEDGNEDEKDRFYGQIQDILNSVKKGDTILVLGDFNAKVGTDSDLRGGVIGPFGTGSSNGQRLLQRIEKPFLAAVEETLGDRYTENMENIYKITIHYVLSTVVRGFELGDPVLPAPFSEEEDASAPEASLSPTEPEECPGQTLSEL